MLSIDKITYWKRNHYNIEIDAKFVPFIVTYSGDVAKQLTIHTWKLGKELWQKPWVFERLDGEKTSQLCDFAGRL